MLHNSHGDPDGMWTLTVASFALTALIALSNLILSYALVAILLLLFVTGRIESAEAQDIGAMAAMVLGTTGATGILSGSASVGLGGVYAYRRKMKIDSGQESGHGPENG